MATLGLYCRMMRWDKPVFWIVAAALFPLCLSGCDRVKEWAGVKKSGQLSRKSETPSIGQYDKVALKRKFGEPDEVAGKLGWIKKEHGLRYNNKWSYYYRKNRDSRKLTMRILYFIDDEFQGSVIIDEDGRSKREKVGFL